VEAISLTALASKGWRMKEEAHSKPPFFCCLGVFPFFFLAYKAVDDVDVDVDVVVATLVGWWILNAAAVLVDAARMHITIRLFIVLGDTWYVTSYCAN